MGLINVGHIIKQIKNIVWNESQRRSQDFWLGAAKPRWGRLHLL
jgi:hypothetical protein